MKLLAVFCLASLASDAVALHVQPRQAGDGCATAAAAGKGGRVSPSVATSCLKAVQLKKPNTVKLITQLKQYLQWHSLTDVLVNPGADYTQNIGPAVDLQAGLDAIASQVNTGTLTSEYELGSQLYTLYNSAQDAHLVYVHDVYCKAFTYSRRFTLASISLDGKALPKLYLFSDVLVKLANKTFIPSAVATINNVNATTFIKDASKQSSLTDPDARYNNMIYQPGAAIYGDQNGVIGGRERGKCTDFGDTLVLKHENGTVVTFQNDAEVAQDFSGVTNAEVLSSKLFQPSTVRTVASPDATQAFNDPIPNYLCAPLAMIQPCSPFLRKREAAPQLPPPAVKVSPTATASPAAIASPTATTSPTATASPVPAASPAAPVYPPPVVSHSKKWISCYFLEGAQANTAVLSVPSFLDDTASDDPLVLEWQVVAKSCISKIKAAGKTSLILDMRSNNGGKITAGYFLLQQLFPNQTHFMGTRMRANSGLNLVGKEVERLANKNLKKPSAVQNAVLGNSFNYKQNVDTAGAKFPSWAAMYGPRPNGFTNVFRDDLSDIAYLKNDTGIDLTRAASQPFLASRIKILTDGYCTSTCHSFGALMAQAGVQSVYVGGRPQAGVPKAFGGTGGTQVAELALLFWNINHIVNDEIIEPSADQRSILALTSLGKYEDRPIVRSSPFYPPVVNLRDGFTLGPEVPLQIRYDAASKASCRMFFKFETLLDQSALFADVADAAFNGKAAQLCAT